MRKDRIAQTVFQILIIIGIFSLTLGIFFGIRTDQETKNIKESNMEQNKDAELMGLRHEYREHRRALIKLGNYAKSYYDDCHYWPLEKLDLSAYSVRCNTGYSEEEKYLAQGYVASMPIVRDYKLLCPIHNVNDNHDCTQKRKIIETAIMMYKTDNSDIPPSKLDMLSKWYMPKNKEIDFCCPISSTKYQYDCGNFTPGRFTIYCQGNKFAELGVSQGYPQYTSETGLVEEFK